ncbi:hypothetical protein ACLOJK_029433 [Asimina triloba]
MSCSEGFKRGNGTVMQIGVQLGPGSTRTRPAKPEKNRGIVSPHFHSSPVPPLCASPLCPKSSSSDSPSPNSASSFHSAAPDQSSSLSLVFPFRRPAILPLPPSLSLVQPFFLSPHPLPPSLSHVRPFFLSPHPLPPSLSPAQRLRLSFQASIAVKVPTLSCLPCFPCFSCPALPASLERFAFLLSSLLSLSPSTSPSPPLQIRLPYNFTR